MPSIIEEALHRASNKMIAEEENTVLAAKVLHKGTIITP